LTGKDAKITDVKGFKKITDSKFEDDLDGLDEIYSVNVKGD